MKLVDTSVWIDFFRGRPALASLAEPMRDGLVLMHPWVLGEIALGSLGGKRQSILDDLARFPAASVVPPPELLAFIDHHSLGGLGIGWVDVQLLASAKLAGADLLTTDRRLARVWQRISPGRSPA
jgi:predicted nucleic acid-binding protein